MDPYKNIIIICLLGVILIGCSILSKKPDNEIEFPTKLKNDDITEIIAGKEIGSDPKNDGNAIKDIVIDLTKEDSERLAVLINNLKKTDGQDR